MTVSTTQSASIMLGNGVSTSFSWSFNNAVPAGQSTSEASYTVIYTSPTGVQTTLASSAYTLSFTAAATGSLWGNGGSLSYPLVGSPIASGATLTLTRTFPLTQTTTISNQGDFSPQVIEEMGDTLEMQIQQVNNRTTQWRGTWMSGVVYNPGDIVQDGANGAGTNNYYLCTVGNTSGTWSTDLGAGDWTLSVQALLPTSNQTITLSGAVTGTGQTAITTAFGTVAATSLLGNVGTATAIPAAISVSANTLVGRNATSSGGIVGISVGSGLAITGTTLGITTVSAAQLNGMSATASSLSADVLLNNTSNYFDGPTITQGNTGTWLVFGSITCTDTAGAANIVAKLWDGTTVIDSGNVFLSTINTIDTITLGGFIVSPAGNLRISAKDPTSTSGKILANNTGNAKDSTITAIRIG